jgi:hypothetical protein
MSKNFLQSGTRQHDVRKAAYDILQSPAFFNRVLEAMGKAGLVGEESNALVLYIAMTSRNSSNPVNVLVKGASSSGKNYLVNRVSALIPSECLCEFSSVSEHAFTYSGDQLAHKVLILQERNKKSGNMHPARLLISDKQIVRKVTHRSRSVRQTVDHVAQGPVCFISTTTKKEIEIDDETRHFSIFVDESPAQTANIVVSCAKDEEKQLTKREVRVWHEIQRIVAARARTHRVKLPLWFTKLAQHTRIDDVRVRRHFPAFKEVCKTVCLLKSFSRYDDDDKCPGALTVKYSDFAIAATIFESALTVRPEGFDRAAETRKVVEEIFEATHQAVTGVDLHKHLDVSMSEAYKRLHHAANIGFVCKLAGNEPKNRKRYVPGVPPSFFPDLETVYRIADIDTRVSYVHPVSGERISLDHRAASHEDESCVAW